MFMSGLDGVVEAVLWGLCVLSTRLCGFFLGVRLVGDSKFAMGENLSVNGRLSLCFSFVR